MTVAPVSATQQPTVQAAERSGFAALGQQDFFRLLTTQMQMQDPFDPVDNKEMLAQMAQFSSLAGISTMGDTLEAIASKLDALVALQMGPAGTDDSTEGQADESSGDTTVQS
jgi:flagellar basal-body rod modification protein FlgD